MLDNAFDFRSAYEKAISGGGFLKPKHDPAFLSQTSSRSRTVFASAFVPLLPSVLSSASCVEVFANRTGEICSVVGLSTVGLAVGYGIAAGATTASATLSDLAVVPGWRQGVHGYPVDGNHYRTSPHWTFVTSFAL